MEEFGYSSLKALQLLCQHEVVEQINEYGSCICTVDSTQ